MKLVNPAAASQVPVVCQATKEPKVKRVISERLVAKGQRVIKAFLAGQELPVQQADLVCKVSVDQGEPRVRKVILDPSAHLDPKVPLARRVTKETPVSLADRDRRAARVTSEQLGSQVEPVNLVLEVFQALKALLVQRVTPEFADPREPAVLKAVQERRAAKVTLDPKAFKVSPVKLDEPALRDFLVLEASQVSKVLSVRRATRVILVHAERQEP